MAKHVLEGKTTGYKHHPQLKRFKKAKYPLDLINQYLSEVYHEAVSRKFKFDKQKINWKFKKGKMPVTTGQVDYEVEHLLTKLGKRDRNRYEELKSKSKFDHHPIFELVNGEIEEWEVLAPRTNAITA